MPRKKRAKKVEKKQVKFADGKSEDPDIESLEEILGHTKSKTFSHASEEELQEELESMNLSSLQELAVRSEVFPSGTKTSLKNKLIKKFKTETTGGAKRTLAFSKPIIDPNGEAGKDALKFLKENF